MEDKEPNIYPLLDLFLLAVFIFALSQHDAIMKKDQQIKESFFYKFYYIGNNNVLYVKPEEEKKELKEITQLENASIENIANILKDDFQTTVGVNKYILHTAYGMMAESGEIENFNTALKQVESQLKLKILRETTERLLEVNHIAGSLSAERYAENTLKDEEVVTYAKQQINKENGMFKGIMIRFDDSKNIASTMQSLANCNIRLIFNVYDSKK